MTPRWRGHVRHASATSRQREPPATLAYLNASAKLALAGVIFRVSVAEGHVSVADAPPNVCSATLY